MATSPENPSDQKIKQWIERIEPLHFDIRTLLLSQEIYITLQNVVEAPPDPSSDSGKFHFYWWCCINYGTSVAVGIRRHLNHGHNLIGLLEDFAKSPEKLSRALLIKPYNQGAQADADGWFSQVFGAEHAHVPKYRLDEDVGNLKSSGCKIEAFATYWLAHLLPSKPEAQRLDFTAKDANDCLGVIKRIFEVYYTFLRPYQNCELFPLSVFRTQEIVPSVLVLEATLRKMWHDEAH
ncbi:MAG: hypothetical protein ACYDC3_06225 [Candidatus Binataceae bacterium]